MRELLVKVFAVSVIYLIMSLPLGQATSLVTIQDPLGSLTATLHDVVFRTVTPIPLSGSKYDIKFSLLSNPQLAKGAQPMTEIHVYKCKDLDPIACLESSVIQKELFAPNDVTLDFTLKWDEIAGQGGLEGKVLLLVKTSNVFGGSWQAYWHHLQKTDSFSIPFDTTQDVTSIVYVPKGTTQAADIQRFILDYGMLPANSQWLTSVTLSGATHLSTLSGDTPPSFVTEYLQNTNSITSSAKKYVIALAHGTQIFNGVTFAQNPSFTIGDGFCDNGQAGRPNLGENSANSCADCGCAAGQYCDLSNACKLLSSVALSTIQPVSTTVNNCFVANTVNIGLRIENAPTGVTVTSKTHTLNGQPSGTLTCTQKTTSDYVCEVPIPADPKCDAGSFILKNNAIQFAVEFSNGNNPVKETKIISTPFPDVTVGSYTCGNNVCEEHLGEKGKCCLDCPCGAGLYCDKGSSEPPSSGYCNSVPSNANLQISKIDPTHLTGYTPNTKVTFTATVTNAPKTLSIGTPGCSLSCSVSGQPCIATCALSCSQSQTTNSVYNSQCSMSLSIQDYDQEKDYTLRPAISFPLNYKDGTQSREKTIQTSFGPISVTKSFCGDNTCLPTEQGSCCFDCGCATGEFCNTPFRTASGGQCRSQDMRLIVDSPVLTVSFADQDKSHVVDFKGRITNVPFGFSLQSTSCSFGDAKNPGCALKCDPVSPFGISEYPLTCKIFIPKFSNYTNSKFFDQNARKIILKPNTISATFSFHNRSNIETKKVSASLPNIEIQPARKCGNNICDSFYGENPGNCCIDCQCGSGSVCIPGGTNPNSQCIDRSNIKLTFDETNPKIPVCRIMPPNQGNNCKFNENMNIFVDVANMPSTIQLVNNQHISATATLQGRNHDTDCYPTTANPSKFRCGIELENIDDLTVGESQETVDLSLEFSYTDHGIKLFESLSTTAQFTVKRIESQELVTCNNEKKRLDDEIERTAGKKSRLKIWSGVIGGLFQILAAINYILDNTCGCPTACAPCTAIPPYPEQTAIPEGTWFVLFSACPLYIYWSLSPDYESKMRQYQIQRDGVCAAPDYDKLKNNIQASDNEWQKVGTVVSQIICYAAASQLLGVTGGSSGSGGGGGSGVATGGAPGVV